MLCQLWEYFYSTTLRRVSTVLPVLWTSNILKTCCAMCWGGSHQVAVNIKSECCCWTSQHSMKEEFWPRLHISASASRPLSAGAWRWWRSEGLARKTSTFFSSLCFHSEMMYCRLQSKVPVIKMTLLRSVLYFKQLKPKIEKDIQNIITSLCKTHQ